MAAVLSAWIALVLVFAAGIMIGLLLAYVNQRTAVRR
jgi:hypothetical protein